MINQGIDLFDKNNKQIELNHVITIEMQYIDYIDHEIGGPSQISNEIFLVFFQKGKYRIRSIKSWHEHLIGVLNGKVIGVNVILGQEFTEYDWIQEYSQKEIEIIGKYNSCNNQIQFYQK